MIDTSGLAFPKGKTKKQAKAKQDRHAKAVEKSIRLQVLERDYRCRMKGWFKGDQFPNRPPGAPGWQCEGFDEWAHLHSHRRSQTRGQAPEQRHTTAGSLTLCSYHHAQFDRHELVITALTRKGADGPMKFRGSK